MRGFRSVGLKYFSELNREHFSFSSLCQKVVILVLIRDFSCIFVWGDVSISIGHGMSYFMAAWETVYHQDQGGIGMLCRVRIAWINEVLHGPSLLIWSTRENCLRCIRAGMGRVPAMRYKKGSGVSLQSLNVDLRDPL